MSTDFTGFSFDGIHSSRLGIVRVSGGDRYDEGLIPEIDDKTTEIPGNDGEYFFGSRYGTKSHTIQIAYDSVTEKQFRQIRRLFGTKKNCTLVFDERPYKVYYAKVKDPIELNYVCFDQTVYDEEVIPEGGIWDREDEVHRDIVRKQPRLDGNGNVVKERIYKGEGTIELISYYPFAHQQFKILDLYRNTSELIGNPITLYSNVDEWAESSGLLTAEQFETYQIDQTIACDITPYNVQIPVYNPGDLDTGFFLYIPFDSNGKISPNTGDHIEINADSEVMFLKEIETKDVSRAKGETGIIINTVNHLIEGVVYNVVTENNGVVTATWETTGYLYNEFIEVGRFPKIRHNDWYFDDEQHVQTIHINCAAGTNIQIQYDYLYF